ncbi:GNAT family N-acetyltransferase [Streptomyces sp. NPDC005562]|uniref:GNAT family N-acetyltransferase n=1 Tax=Streptomyces sp. NPDC005562 TaxID=3154890 RepID=UPI0033AC6347
MPEPERMTPLGIRALRIPALRIRALREADCEAVATLRVLGWRSAYAGLMPQPFLDALSVEESAAQLRERLARGGAATVDLVAERAGRVVGWIAFGPARDDDLPPGEAELYALYAHPEQYSTGVGRALLLECVARCTADSHAALRLWVVEGNARARRFYERFGFAADGALDPQTVGDMAVPELRYRRDLA